MASFFGFGGAASADQPPPYSERDGISITLPPPKAPLQPTPSSSSSSSSTSSLSSSSLGDWNPIFEDTDPVSLVLETYTLSLVTGPLVVVETLQEAQVHSRDRSDGSSATELDMYEAAGAATPAAAVGSSAAETAIVPRLSGDVWANVRAVSQSRAVGTLGLLRGHATSFVHTLLSRICVPVAEEALNDALDVFDDTHPATALAASVLVGVALSPLELVRTRLILQNHTEKRYYGPIHAAAAIHASEGPHGFSPLYARSHLVPTIVCRALASVMHSLSKNIIARDLGLSAEYNPLLHTLAVLVFLTAEVFVVTPFELARKRLQVQSLKPDGSRNPGEAVVPFPACVELSTRKYTGMFDVIRWVISEEGGDHHAATSSATVTSAAPTVSAKARSDLDPFDDFGWDSASKSSRSGGAAGDWQDLYATPASKKRSDSNVKPKSSLAKSWDGMRSLYRGFWTRYAIRVVEFAFESMREAGDSAFII
ncbi:hypothetical protein HDU82_007460 [Entophlyctis luteolus]|nr:hypothetical protein HDU82_007460 [Entophlyctis luteolus]KAJ3382166.1 hypothetical protein HDU84_004579 [Entophlyctis sp. JEL0112]